MIILAIDPGLSGAWAMINHHGTYIACGDMIHNGKHLLTNQMVAEIVKARNGEDLEAVLELVHSMPGQGVASTFKFGTVYGCAIALVERLNCPFHFVSPREWKKSFGLDADKNKSLELARKLWPDAPLKRKKDNGRAEALLIAYWLKNEHGY